MTSSTPIREGSKSSRHGPYENLKSYDLDTYLRASIPTALFDTQERDKVGKFRGEVLTLYNASKTKGGLTSEAADFEDKYRDLGGYDAKMKEIFGVSLNDLN